MARSNELAFDTFCMKDVFEIFIDALYPVVVDALSLIIQKAPSTEVVLAEQFQKAWVELSQDLFSVKVVFVTLIPSPDG
jgi:hypothetical protein